MSSSFRSGFNTQRLVSVSGDSLKTCGSDLLCFFICSLSLKCRIHCNSISRHCERISHCAVRSRRARLYLNGLVGLAGRSILALSGFGFHYCHCVDFVIGVRLNGKCNLCARSSSRRIRQSHCAVSDTSRRCDSVCYRSFAIGKGLSSAIIVPHAACESLLHSDKFIQCFSGILHGFDISSIYKECYLISVGINLKEMILTLVFVLIDQIISNFTFAKINSHFSKSNCFGINLRILFRAFFTSYSIQINCILASAQAQILRVVAAFPSIQ